MTLKGMIGRFLLMYVGLTIAAGIILQLLSMKSNSGLTVGILFGSVFFAHQKWAKRNQRRFEGTERRDTAIGMLLAELLFGVVQFLLIDAAIPQNAIIVIVGIAAAFLLIHAFVIYFALGLSEKQMIQRGFV